MDFKVIYLFFVFYVCCVCASPHHQDGHDSDDRGLELQVSPDSEGGHQVSNNHFSTSEMDEGDRDPPTTVTPSQMETTTDHKSAVPEEVPTTHKIDAKKDLNKKKVKPTPKKKEKGVESDEASVNDDSDNVDESIHEITQDADITTQVPFTTTNHYEGDADKSTTTFPSERLNEDTFTTTETASEGMGTMSPTSAPLTTTKNENLLSSDEQPPQTTVNDVIAETTTTMRQQPREEIESQADTTTIPPTTEIPQVETTPSGVKMTEIDEKEEVDSTEPHLNAEMETTTSTAAPMTTDLDFERETNSLRDDPQPTTLLPMTVVDSESDKNSLVNDLQSTTLLPRDVVDSKSDNNSLGNDLKPTSVPDTVRKQKQMVLDGGCPCGPSFSQCVGGRTVADPTCPCREVCARQSGQPCSPGEPCDEEFGLHCNLQNNTCTGPLSIRIFDVSSQSAKVTWGMSESELQPQALVFYTSTYRGSHTQWTKVHDIKPVITLENLLPNKNYYLKVEEDGKQEISTFKTKENMSSNMPKILVKQKSQTSLTVVWDDFRLPSYHSEYVLEYRRASDASQNWTKVQAGTQTIVTVSGLTPNTPYEVKVAVWEDDKLELPSEVITAYTSDGCVRENQTYSVSEPFYLGCDFRCTCNGNNESDCSPRCNAPYVPIGSKTDDPQCYEKVVPSDPCCVTIRCTESKALEDLEDVKNKSGECPEILEESESCLSDCDHDRDCSGALKCCPSSCGGAVCVQPLAPEDVCEHVYCGPNAECVSAKMACVCSQGFEGNPHDFLNGCLPVNSTSNNTETEVDKENVETTTDDSRNELEDRKTDAPFELDLSSKDAHQENDTTEAVLFDGCEFNNITYDRGVKFQDGCDALCVCEGRGHVSCVPRCNVLSSGGPACREVPDPDDACCKIMVCSFPGSSESEHVDALPMKIVSALAQNGTSVRIRIATSTSHPPAMAGRDTLEVWYKEANDKDLSQWHKKPVAQKELGEIERGLFEFDLHDLKPQTDYYIKVGRDSHGGAGLNMAEFSNTVNVKTFPAIVKSVSEGCFHHNRSYSLGETFYEGCEHRCVCREKGFIECQDRCAIYVDTVGYENCDWVQSDEDPCCSVPLCNRRKIPLMIDERPAIGGQPTNFCVVSPDEVYRVGDIWESADGCRTKICRCTQMPNGTTAVQCQSECPPLPPNAHIPTARCPHPMLVKPDGPCKCPYVSCEEVPPRHVVHPPRPQCEYKGERYAMGQEFYDGCNAVCHCGQDLRVNCAAVECPYHFGAEFTNCLEWDIDPNFFPVPPKCCAPAKCKNDGSCLFSGRKFQNFEDIPSDMLPCGARCVCVNGNVTCENRCPPIEDTPPVNLPCPPNMAHKAHPEGEDCCMQWMCKETHKQVFCQFQGSRYLVDEKWEVQKGSQQRTCVCHLTSEGHPEVECRGGCPQIPQRFLLPTEQCLRPVIVTPDDPLMCPYVVCNNTLSGQELYNVNVMAMNSTAVRIRFSLSNILVGLIGHAELHFTTDPTLPPGQWHVQKFSRPKRLFDSPNIEYVLNALKSNTTYFLQVKIKIDALQGGPESELFKLTMPPEATTPSPPTTPVTIPPLVTIDASPEAHTLDATTVRVSWKNLDPEEKRFIYALQLRYKTDNDQWTTTPMIHRDVTSYFLHDLKPDSHYQLDLLFTPPEDLPTKVVSAKELEFRTPAKPKEEYNIKVSVADVLSDRSSFRLSGIPDPLTKHVHVIKVIYKADGQESYSFQVPDHSLSVDHLKPGKKYVAQLELYLTNGQTLTSNEVEFVTKPVKKDEENLIPQDVPPSSSKQAELVASSHGGGDSSDENRAYFVALVVVAVVAAVAGFGFVLLLVLLVRRQASAKAPISRTPSESAYDNPTYKTYDGERTEDKTNGQTIQTTQA